MEINYRSASYLQLTVLWWCFIIVFQFHKATAVCIFGPGPDCAFPCRCSDSTSGTSGGLCDSVTGVCNTGACKSVASSSTYIGQAWSGDGCQTGNVALEKTASVVNGAPAAAEKAVDGFTGARASSSHCISIDTGDSNVGVWWMVDFGSLHKISSFTVYNSYNSTESTYLEKFYFRQGNESNPLSHTGCTTQHDPVPAGGSVTHKCPVTARYISIAKFGGTKSKMTLCELEVTGHKYYNVDCSRCAGTCHQDLWCQQCRTGWLEPDCRNAASSSCPAHCNCPSNNICDTCHKWYLPDGTCDKNIPSVGVGSQSTPVLSAVTDTSLTVNYKQADLSSVHADVHQYYFYTLKYKKAGASNYIQISNLSHSSNRDRLVNITGLQSDTTYEVVLDIYKKYVRKGWSEKIKELGPVSTKTLCSSPVKPSGVTVVPNASGIKVSWVSIGYPPCNVPTKIEVSIGGALYALYNGLPPSMDRSNTQTFTQFITPETHTVFIKVTYNDGTVINSDGITVSVTAVPSSTAKTTSSTNQPVTCPIHCSCNSVTNQCQTCNKWYIPDGMCNKHIDTITLESDSIPVVKNPTRSTLTVSFRQDDLTGIPQDIQQYYFYQVRYTKLGEIAFKSTSLIQHDSNQGVSRAQRTVILKDLIEGTSYEIALAAFRQFSTNNWNELIAETGTTSAKTICPSPVSPKGISILSKPNSMKVMWMDLGYYNCNKPTEGVIEYSLHESDISWCLYSLNNSIKNQAGPGDVSVANIFPGKYDVVIKLYYNDIYLQSKVSVVNIENSQDLKSAAVNIVAGVLSTIIIILVVLLATIIFFFIKMKRKLNSKGEAQPSSNVYYNKTVVSVNDIEVMGKDNVVYQDIDGQVQREVNGQEPAAYEELQIQKEKIYDNEDVKPYSDLQLNK